MNDLFGNYRSDVSGVVWPPLARNTAALVDSYAARLSETQWLDPAGIAVLQRRQLGLLAQHCALHSPAFAARLTAADLSPAELAEPGGLQRLPPLTRRALQDYGDDLFCREVPHDHLPLGLNSTSGSTGEPVKVRRTALNHLGWMAMTLRDHQWQRRDPRLRLAGMSAHCYAVKASDDWGPPIATLFQTGPGLALPATLAIAEMLPVLRDFRPQILVAYPSVLGALLDLLEPGDAAVADLRHIRCMSEMVGPDLRARVEAQLGIKLEDGYTSEEFGFIALQCPDAGGYHTLAETHLVEVVDSASQPCAPGATGRVLVTDLHNFATPMIRYDIGDFAVAGAACPCGRGLPRIERIVGRERNLVRLPDGSRHWPLTGYPVYRTLAPVRQYQLIQHDPATVEMRLVVERALTSDEEAALAAQVRRSLGHDFAIRFAYFNGRLPTGTGGKFEEFICHVRD